MSNNNTALIPQIWANETLMVLFEEMVAARLVYRNFESEIRQFGDVVNTRIPGTFSAKRKSDDDDVTVQPATLTNIAIPLNQHIHTSFIIKDGEETKSMQSLVETHMRPAAKSLSQAIDRIVLGQVARWGFKHRVGKLLTTPTVGTITAIDRKMNENKAPMDGRRLIVSPGMREQLLNIEAFHEADKLGDSGSALRSASLGRKFNFDILMSLNIPNAIASETDTGSTVDGDHARGAVSIALPTGGDSNFDPGDTVVIDGHPYVVRTSSGGALGIWPGLSNDVADTAVITKYAPAAVDLSAGYAIGWYKPIKIKTVTQVEVGQTVLFPTAYTAGDLEAAPKYTIIDVGTAEITLDRPLETALANSAVVSLGPRGNYNFAFNSQAIALISRPLAMPLVGAGALSSVASLDGLGLRVTISYDGNKQGHLVTIDTLMGVQKLYDEMGVVAFS